MCAASVSERTIHLYHLSCYYPQKETGNYHFRIKGQWKIQFVYVQLILLGYSISARDQDNNDWYLDSIQLAPDIWTTTIGCDFFVWHDCTDPRKARRLRMKYIQFRLSKEVAV